MNDIKQLIEEVGRNIQAVRAGDSQTANDRMGRAAVVAVLKEIKGRYPNSRPWQLGVETLLTEIEGQQ
jgi:hypothetical protein